MAMRPTPWIIDNNTHSAQDARLATAASLGCNITSAFAGGVPASAGLVVDPGHGVCGAGDFKVTQNGTPNMSVNVAAGQAMIRGTISALQGVYTPTNDGTVNLSIAAANATNPRRDLVIVQIRDNAFDAGGMNDARLLVVTGTPAASPVDPSLASYPNSLVLARITVAANATSVTTANIADLRSIAAPWANGRGRVASASVTSNQTGIGTSAVDVTGSSVSVVTLAGRRYRIAGMANLAQSVSATVGVLWITRDTTDIANSSCMMTNTYGFTLTPWAVDSPGAGTFAYKLRAAANTGTIFIAGATSSPTAILVEDIGGFLL